MSPEEMNHGAGEIRTKYAYLFSTIAELYRCYHLNAKPDTRFESIKGLAKELFDEGNLSEYLYESLQETFRLYPTLLPGVVQQAYETNEKQETEHLNRLYALLSIAEADLSQQLHDVIVEDSEHYLKQFK